jgi:DnaJ-class molecular chaperone
MSIKGSKIKEHICPACNGAGFPAVRQPVQSGTKIYPAKCTLCDGKGKIRDAGRAGDDPIKFTADRGA